MHRSLLGAAALLCATAQATESCSVHSTEQRQSLIELYTSEGCSSCPPADRWLARLQEDPRWIPLAFHVDYWDRLGWKDRFGSPAYTQRQHRGAQLRKSRRVYTPQVVADGLEHSRWYSQDLPRRDQSASPVMTLAVKALSSNRVYVQVLAEPADLPAGTIRVALVEDDLSSRVLSGENGGRTLAHAHVVRSLTSDPLSERVQLPLNVPSDLNLEKSAVVAWIEDGGNGAPLQALRLPLRECASWLAAKPQTHK